MNYSNTQSKFLVIWSCILVSLIAIYSPVLSNFPFGDDFVYIFSKLDIANAPSPFSYWELDSKYFKSWPLTFSIIWMLKYVFSDNFEYYRILNLLIHFFNIVLIYKIMRIKKVPNPLIIAAFIAFHSLNVVSIFWIFQIKTIFSSFFILLAIYLYLNSNKKLGYFTLFISFLIKTVGVLIPFAFVKLRSKSTLILFLALSIIAAFGIYGLSSNDPLSSVKSTSHFYFETISFDLIFTKINFIVLSIVQYILHFVGILQSQLIYSFRTFNSYELVAYSLVFSIFIFDLFKNYKDFFLRLFILSIIPVIGIIMIPYQKFTPFSDHWYYLANIFFSIYILNKIFKSDKLKPLFYILFIAQILSTTYFTYRLRDTEKYLVKMQLKQRHPLRDEFLVELYKYQKNYNLALDLAIDSYDYSYRKEELSTNILELANATNRSKAASFARLKKALLYIEKQDYDQAKIMLERIPNEQCNSLCINLKLFI